MTAYEKGIATLEARAARVNELLKTPEDPAARIQLLTVVSDSIAFHKSGKITGIHSLDSSCHCCGFCQDMQEAGKENPAIICGMCYTLAMHETALKAHEPTARILSEVLFTESEWASAPVPFGLLRHNCDGELINLTHARNVIRATKTHPLTRCAIWTKRPGILAKAIEIEGRPENLKIGISSPIINTPYPEKYAFADFVFTVYTPAGMKKALAEGAHECNGKACRACGFFCYTQASASNGAPVNIAEALRKPYNMTAAKFKALCATIDTKTLDAAQELPF